MNIVKACDVLLAPIEMVIETKSVKLYQSTMNIFHKLTMTSLLSDKTAVHAMEIINKFPSGEIANEMILIKALQVIMVFLTPDRIVLTVDFIENALQAALKMLESQSPNITNTVQAALSSLHTLVFEALVVQDDPDRILDDEEVKEGYGADLILNDQIQVKKISQMMLTGLTSQVNPKGKTHWPLEKSSGTIVLALDLLYDIINKSSEAINTYPDIVKILKDSYIPMIELMKESGNDQQLSLRVIRCLTVYTTKLRFGIDHLLAWVLPHVAMPGLSWKKQIALESLCLIMSENQLLIDLITDETKSSLVSILDSVDKYVDSIKIIPRDDQFALSIPTMTSLKTPKTLEERQFSYELGIPELSHILKLVIESVHNIIENLVMIIDLSEDEEFVKKELLQTRHLQHLLSTLRNVLNLCLDETNIQSVLNCFQSLINLFGQFNMNKANAQYLSGLCSFCLPHPAQQARGEDKLSNKNILVSKKVLNIAHCLPNLLDTQCWYIIFATMQNLETHIYMQLKIPQTFDNIDIPGIKRKIVQMSGGMDSDDPFSMSHDKKGLRDLQNSPEMDIHPAGQLIQNQPESGQKQSMRPRTQTTVMPSVKKLNQSTPYQEDLDNILTMMESIMTTHMEKNTVISVISALGQMLTTFVEEAGKQAVGSENEEETKASHGSVKGGKGVKIQAKKGIDKRKPPRVGRKANEDSINPQPVQITQNLSLFGLRHIVQCIIINLPRVKYIWQILTDQLLLISVCNYDNYRKVSIDVLTSIIKEVFEYQITQRKMDTHAEVGYIDPKTNDDDDDDILEDMDEDTDPIERKMSRVSEGVGDEFVEEIIEEVVDDENVHDSPDEELKKKSLVMGTIAQKQSPSKSIGESIQGWDEKQWQLSVLHPLCSSVSNGYYPANLEQVIGALRSVIKQCQQVITPEAWHLLIESFNKACKSKEPKITAKSFKNISFIISKNISRVGFENTKVLIKAVSKYANFNTEDEGKLNEIMELYLCIADFIGESSPNSIEICTGLWKLLVESLKEILLDQRNFILKKTIIKCLETIMLTHSATMTKEVRKQFLEHVLLKLFEKTSQGYLERRGGMTTRRAREKAQDNSLQTPTFSFGPPQTKKGKQPQRRMVFDEETVSNAIKQEQEAEELPGFGAASGGGPNPTQKSKDDIKWEESCLILLEMSSQLCEKYWNEPYQNESEEKMLNLFFQMFMKMVIPLIQTTSSSLLEGMLSHHQHFALNLQELLLKNLDGISLQFFSEISELLQRKPNVLNKNISDSLIQIFSSILSKDNFTKYPNLKKKDNIYNYLTILQINLYNSRPTIGLNAMGAPASLKTEEQNILLFIEHLRDTLISDKTALMDYLLFLLNFLEYNSEEPHLEAFIRRTFDIITKSIEAGNFEPETLHSLLPLLYDSAARIVDLRYDNDACMSLVFPAKHNASLFEEAGLFLLKVSTFVLQSDDASPIKNVRAVMETTAVSDCTGGSTGDEETKVDNLSSTAQPQRTLGLSLDTPEPDKDATSGQSPTKLSGLSLDTYDDDFGIKPVEKISFVDVQQWLLSRIMTLIKDTLMFNVDKIQDHNRAVIDLVIQSSQNLDMQIINFIIQTLLPHSNVLGKQIEFALIEIIDQGCDGYSDTQAGYQNIPVFGGGSATAQNNSLSMYCFNNLFDLCNTIVIDATKPDKNQFIEIRRKIAMSSSPILLNRCRGTIRRYINDEKMSGSISLPQSRVDEIVYILNKLKELEVYTDMMQDLVIDPESENYTQQEKERCSSNLMSSKGHLIALVPIFSELICCKEQEIKDTLQHVFFEISKAIGISPQLTIGRPNSSNAGSGSAEF